MLKNIFFYLILFFVNLLLSGTRFFGLKRMFLNSIGIRVGIDTKIVGPLKIGRIAKLEIGEGCWIGANFTIYGNGEVKIGNNCDFAPDISILTGSHVIGTSERRAGRGITYNYNIGNGTWIGAKTSITKGVTIGSGVVIGACSLVCKVCEDNSVYMGLPAKKTRQLEG